MIAVYLFCWLGCVAGLGLNSSSGWAIGLDARFLHPDLLGRAAHAGFLH